MSGTHLLGKPVALKACTLRGMRGTVVAQSRRTGGLTVELTHTDGSAAYKPGDRVNVMPYQVEVAES